MDAALIETLARAVCRKRCQYKRCHSVGSCQLATPWHGYIGWAESCLAALQAAGMVVMPVEPTEAMIHAAVTAPYGRTLGERVINEYRAMLAAGGAVATAPEAAATEEQG